LNINFQPGDFISFKLTAPLDQVQVSDSITKINVPRTVKVVDRDLAPINVCFNLNIYYKIIFYYLYFYFNLPTSTFLNKCELFIFVFLPVFFHRLIKTFKLNYILLNYKNYFHI
jgi:hypothetical protein